MNTFHPDITAPEVLMPPIFDGTLAVDETVMFLEKGDVKSLLYPIEQVVSVTSYDRTVTYEEGKDYVVVDGNLQVTADSAIPCITREVYYNDPDSILQTEYNGRNVLTHWGEYGIMNDWQVCVTYTHASPWEGFRQPCEAAYFQPLLQKLQKGEDVTLLFYGDSITYGANASWMNNSAPGGYPYPILFTCALADLYSYTVRYRSPDITTPPIPAKVPECNYVAGSRGTITYLNTAIGGWSAWHGAQNFDRYIKDPAEAHGCDLFVIAFGMNDPGPAPETTVANIAQAVDGVLAINPQASIVLLSTMVPNPKATNGWYGNQDKQEAELEKQAAKYREAGVSCGVCRMTSVSLAVLKRQEFHDYSGNNINHPNDYFSRVYAESLLRTVVGDGPRES